MELNAENEPADKNFMGQVRAAEAIKDLPKPVMKQVMPFASFVMKQVPAQHREEGKLSVCDWCRK